MGSRQARGAGWGAGERVLTCHLWDADLLAGAAVPPVADWPDFYDVIFIQRQGELHRRLVCFDDRRAALSAPSVQDLPTQNRRHLLPPRARPPGDDERRFPAGTNDVLGHIWEAHVQTEPLCRYPVLPCPCGGSLKEASGAGGGGV